MKKYLLLVLVSLFVGSFAVAQNQAEPLDVAGQEIVLSEGAEEASLPVVDGERLIDDSYWSLENIEQQTLMLTNHPNRVTAGILAILLGDFGVQHFYTGQIFRGVLDVLFCWTGIPAIIGIVEGIIWLTEDDAAFAARVAKWNN